MEAAKAQQIVSNSRLAYPISLTSVPRERWSPDTYDPKRIEVYLCRRFLVQVFDEGNGIRRLSINRTQRDGDKWLDGITWDELQRIKHDIGMGDAYAVEVYPRDIDIVNVANMRHLWVLPQPLPDVGWAS
jgi:hypothetical protein